MMQPPLGLRDGLLQEPRDDGYEGEEEEDEEDCEAGCLDVLVA